METSRKHWIGIGAGAISDPIVFAKFKRHLTLIRNLLLKVITFAMIIRTWRIINMKSEEVVFGLISKSDFQ